MAADLTQIQPAKIYAGCMAFSFFWVLFGLPQTESLILIVMIAYPTLKTMLAIELERDEERKQWLAYWALVAAMTSLEYSPISLVLQMFQPLWLDFKFVMILYLSNPISNRAALQIIKSLPEQSVASDAQLFETVDVKESKNSSVDQKRDEAERERIIKEQQAAKEELVRKEKQDEEEADRKRQQDL